MDAALPSPNTVIAGRLKPFFTPSLPLQGPALMETDMYYVRFPNSVLT